MNREDIEPPPPPGVEQDAPPPPPNRWFYSAQQPGDGMQPGPYPWQQFPNYFNSVQQPVAYPWTMPPPPPPLQQRRPRIELPMFWSRDPRSWFGIAESTFDREGVTDSKYRFDMVLKHVSEDTVEQIRDLLRCVDNLPDPYAALKAELVRLFSPNVLEQLNGIVFAPELGGQAPSQLMGKMLSMLPAGEPAGLLFKHHFVLRMPADIRDQIAKKIEKLGAKELAEYADTRWHIRNSRPPATGVAAAVQSPPAVEELTDAVAAINTGGQKNNRRRRREKQPGGEKPAGKAWFCFNHTRYGKGAWSCNDTKNCSFQGNGEAGGQ